MLRLSVTDLDSFRYWQQAEDEYMDTAALLRRLRREEPPSREMAAGKALHSLLEHGTEAVLETSVADGIKFYFTLDAALTLPPIRELKGERVYQTPVGPVTLVGKVDGLSGLSVLDYKLTSKFDAERYMESYQWRCYLSIFGARRFDYLVFVGYEELGEWEVRELHPLTFYRYAGMDEDVAGAVSQFAEFVAENMPERLQASIAA